ncbi:uncharacterized protein NPIL_625711 [Nephila pilipes]|uniref:Uncharacterized protein n=1 Tax=Nephila pilipes TaxID=299642 RepID=A0A8X6PN83_NEPPI|nr:uncharacterized protein NPIL_625711 [Nephila pilipes]
MSSFFNSHKIEVTIAYLISGDEDYGEFEDLSLQNFFYDTDSEESFSNSEIEKEMSLDHQEIQLPKELELRAGSQPLKCTLWTKVQLSRGKRFGPIPAQLKDTEPTRLSAWKVSHVFCEGISVRYYFTLIHCNAVSPQHLKI